MNKCFEATEKFLVKCDEVEMEFAYSISDSIHEGVLSHDSNYRDAHTEVMLEFIDIYTGFRGKVPEPLFSQRIDSLMETINTDCGW